MQCVSNFKTKAYPLNNKKSIPFVHKDHKEYIGLKADTVIENKVIVQIKSVDTNDPVHHK